MVCSGREAVATACVRGIPHEGAVTPLGGDSKYIFPCVPGHKQNHCFSVTAENSCMILCSTAVRRDRVSVTPPQCRCVGAGCDRASDTLAYGHGALPEKSRASREAPSSYNNLATWGRSNHKATVDQRLDSKQSTAKVCNAAAGGAMPRLQMPTRDRKPAGCAALLVHVAYLSYSHGTWPHGLLE